MKTSRASSEMGGGIKSPWNRTFYSITMLENSTEYSCRDSCHYNPKLKARNFQPCHRNLFSRGHTVNQAMHSALNKQQRYTTTVVRKTDGILLSWVLQCAPSMLEHLGLPPLQPIPPPSLSFDSSLVHWLLLPWQPHSVPTRTYRTQRSIPHTIIAS